MSQSTGKKSYYIESPITGWAQMPYNTKEVLQESGEWESPITGWVKVTCIGGGAAGSSMATSNGSSMYSIQENPGGATSFGNIIAQGGFPYGGGSVNAVGTGAGGAAGEVKTEYVKVEVGELISYSIGAGGTATGAFKSVTGDFCKEYPGGGWGGLYWTSSPLLRLGVSGGSNGTPYGGGGGSACGSIGGTGTYVGAGAAGGANGTAGQLTTSHTVNLGGHGGGGAIVLEYADLKKKA